MKAIVMTATGNTDVLALQDVAEPQITEPTQIKVQLKAAGVNPVDTKIRRHGLFGSGVLPAILGCDGAGVVTEIGSAVDKFKPGDQVWFCNGGLGDDPGNYAQTTVLNQRWASLKPTSLSFIEAAAAPLVLITAWGALFDRGGLQPGQTVLIHAGAGGVGHVAIQLAKIHGARVIATISNEEKAQFVKALGADEVVIYQPKGFADAVNQLTHGNGADVVFDTVGPSVFKESIAVTAHFGRLVTILDPGDTPLNEARMRNLLIGFELMLTPMLRRLDTARDKQVAILDQCKQWIDTGRLKMHVSEILPLDQVALAHQHIEAGHTTGKIVLTITD